MGAFYLVFGPMELSAELGYTTHGWWYGWKLPLAVVVGSVWLPLAAEFTPASDADNVIAPKLLTQLPMAVRYVLGDTHDNTPELRQECAVHNRELVATRRGPYPHRDGGVAVRRIFHKLPLQRHLQNMLFYHKG
jgi:hypothetical protein